MKKAVLTVLLVFASPALAQQSLPSGYAAESRGFGRFNATIYNQWKAVVVNGNAATGAQTIQVQYGGYPLPDGNVIFPFNVNAPITIDFGSNQETVTPTAVSGCNITSGNPIPSLCNITATFANTHGQGTPIFSGSFGLQEALNDAFAKGGGIVTIDQAWGGTNTTIASAIPYSGVVIEDERGPFTQYYAARPTGSTALASGSAPTVSITGTGSLSSGAYRVEYMYVDLNGQFGTSSTESTQTGTTTILTVTAPAASAGAVGYIPCITAAAGAANTEICVPVTSSICTLTKLESITPACAVTNATYGQTGSNAVITANPSATMKLIGEGTATDTSSISRTVYAYVPVGSSFPLPFQSIVTNQTSQAAGTGTYEIATFNLPANFFNFIGRRYKFCFDAHVTSAANSGVLTFNLYYGPYNNSDTKLIALGPTGAFSGTTQATLNSCTIITPTALGATGSLNPVGFLDAALAGTSVDTRIAQTQSVAVPVTSLPLTTNQQLRFEEVLGTGALGSAVTYDDISLEPAN